MTVYWKSKSGKIAVDDMTGEHAKNVLKMLIRNNMIRPPEQTVNKDKWDYLYLDHLEAQAQEEI